MLGVVGELTGGGGGGGGGELTGGGGGGGKILFGPMDTYINYVSVIKHFNPQCVPTFCL